MNDSKLRGKSNTAGPLNTSLLKTGIQLFFIKIFKKLHDNRWEFPSLKNESITLRVHINNSSGTFWKTLCHKFYYKKKWSQRFQISE